MAYGGRVDATDILAHCRSFRKCCGLWLGANLAVASSKVPCQVSTFPETSATRKY